MVSLHNGIIETDLFTKPTDKHQHLLNSSCHPHHTKKAILFSLALRLHRICSTDAKFKHRINELKTYLLARDYNNNFLEKQFLLDCKTVGFFSKSVKKSVKRGVRVLRARSAQSRSWSRSLFSASFQTFCLTARAYLNTQKY